MATTSGAPSISLAQPNSGSFDIDASRGHVRVHLELRRGALRPQEWQGAVAVDGRYEGDVLMADGAGRVVMAEFGGHAPVDPTWGGRIEQPHGVVDFELRRQELALAVEVAGILAADARLDAESKILARGLAASLRATLDGYDEGPDAVARAEPSAQGGTHEDAPGETGTVDKAARYVHQVYIRGGSCCWPGYHHSAARLRIFNASGGLLADVKARNHGRWVDDPSLSTAVGCPKSWSGRANQTPLFVPWRSDTFGSGQAGGCSSAYGPLSGQHVCNDDSYAEYQNVKNNPFIVPDYATCSDSTLRGVAPSCT